MAEGEPELLVPRRAPDDRHHVRRAGPRAHPRIRVEPLGEREELARDGLGAVELDRGFHAVAQRELGPGGEPDAGTHRREEIAALGVEHRVVEHGGTGGTVVHVVAALDRERQVVAQRPRDGFGPWSESDDRVARRDPPFHRTHFPARLERRGVALHEAPAKLLE
jgi:hypothetical protein